MAKLVRIVDTSQFDHFFSIIGRFDTTGNHAAKVVAFKSLMSGL